MKAFAGYFLAASALVMLAATILFKGNPAPFFSLPFIILGISAFTGLCVAVYVQLRKCGYTGALLHACAALLIGAYGINEHFFFFEEIPAASFTQQRSIPFTDKTALLIKHELYERGRLKNIEQAHFIIDGTECEASLNHPIAVSPGVKLYVTGTGETFLVTRSILIPLVLAGSLLFLLFLGMWSFMRRRDV